MNRIDPQFFDDLNKRAAKRKAEREQKPPPKADDAGPSKKDASKKDPFRKKKPKKPAKLEQPPEDFNPFAFEEETAKLRSEEEVKNINKIIAAVLNGQLPPIAPQGMYALQIIKDFCCWLLQHGHPTTFGEALVYIKQQAENHGLIPPETEGE